MSMFPLNGLKVAITVQVHSLRNVSEGHALRDILDLFKVYIYSINQIHMFPDANKQLTIYRENVVHNNIWTSQIDFRKR